MHKRQKQKSAQKELVILCLNTAEDLKEIMYFFPYFNYYPFFSEARKQKWNKIIRSYSMLF
jgi:hypothetical protein